DLLDVGDDSAGGLPDVLQFGHTPSFDPAVEDPRMHVGYQRRLRLTLVRTRSGYGSFSEAGRGFEICSGTEFPAAYFPNQDRITWPPTVAASRPPFCAFSITTATAMVGLSAGAKPTNQPCGDPCGFSAVPVLPATWMPEIAAGYANALGPSTAYTMSAA